MSDNSAKLLQIRKITDEKEFFCLKEEWNTLLSHSRAESIFLTWEWLWTWWNIYKSNSRNLCILLVFRGQDLIGIGPFYVISKSYKSMFKLRRLMFLGTDEKGLLSEYMDIISRAGDEQDVISNVLGYLYNQNICEDIFLHKINSLSSSLRLLRSVSQNKEMFYVIADEYESPFISLPADYNTFMKSIDGAFRQKLRKNQNKLRKMNNVVIRKTNDIAEFKHDFSELVRLHQMRWESKKLEGSFSDKNFKDFHHAIMPVLLNNKQLDLWFLSVGGINISSLYNIRYKNKIYFYMAGLDIDFEKSIAPGFLLHDYCISNAIENRIGEYDFMLMGYLDSYKKKWTTKSKSMADVYIACANPIKLLMPIKYKAKSFYRVLNRGLGLN